MVAKPSFCALAVRSKKLAAGNSIKSWLATATDRALRRVRELLEKSVIRCMPQPIMDEMMIYLATLGL